MPNFLRDMCICTYRYFGSISDSGRRGKKRKKRRKKKKRKEKREKEKLRKYSDIVQCDAESLEGFLHLYVSVLCVGF
jgi:hypothetical protein